MTGWNRVTGHTEAINYFKSTLERKLPQNAYLISGERGSGKKLLASIFAKGLVCEGDGSRPCMKCRACNQAKDGNHPDIRYLIREKANTISVKEIREQIVDDIVIRPYQAEYKVYIIDEADRMTEQAQNALLKTLEEPPAYAIILLLTTRPKQLLLTIRSRCMHLKLKELTDGQVAGFLKERGYDESRIRVSTAFAKGNIGRALEIAESPKFNELVEDVVGLVRNADDMKAYEVMEAIGRIQKHKDDLNGFFDLMLIWYRDVLVYKSTGDVGVVTFRGEEQHIRRQAERKSFEGIRQILEAIDKAKTRLAANVNFDIVAELLVLTIKEN